MSSMFHCIYDVLMRIIEFSTHPLPPQFIQKWRRSKYIEEGRRRGASYVVTVCDYIYELGVFKVEFIKPGESVDEIVLRIKRGPFSVGEVIKVE